MSKLGGSSQMKGMHGGGLMKPKKGGSGVVSGKGTIKTVFKDAKALLGKGR